MSLLRFHVVSVLVAACAVTSGCALDARTEGAADEHAGFTSEALTLTATIPKNTTLHAGDEVYSSSRRVILSMQSDGNLVLYWNPFGTWSQSIWASNTNGHTGASASMQSDGNFVVYDASGSALWSSGTNGSGDHVSVQDDGNLVVYDASGSARWASGSDVNVPPSSLCTDEYHADGNISYRVQFCPAGSWWKYCGPLIDTGSLFEVACDYTNGNSGLNENYFKSLTTIASAKWCRDKNGTMDCSY